MGILYMERRSLYWDGVQISNSHDIPQIGFGCELSVHYDDVIMMAIASKITNLTIVYSAVYSGAHQRKHQSSASLAFVWGIHRGPVNSPHKWPVTRKMFPFDDVIMGCVVSIWRVLTVLQRGSTVYKLQRCLCGNVHVLETNNIPSICPENLYCTLITKA